MTQLNLDKETKMRRSKLMFLLIVFLLLSNKMFGLIVLNESQKGYEKPIGTNELITGDEQIKFYIIQGAGYFLKSDSNFQLFLNIIELADINGLNYDDLKKVLNNTIYSMEFAKTSYSDLINVAEKTPYNQVIIDKLKFFDYDSFQKNKGLICDIIQKIKSFLINGNITGAYKEVYSYTVESLIYLNEIKEEIDNKLSPDVSLLWLLNQKYSECKLFGQYISQIFFEIK